MNLLNMSIRFHWAKILFLLTLALDVVTATAIEETKGPTPKESLSIKAANPVGNLISVAFKNTVDFGAPNGSAYFLNTVPVFPLTLGGSDLINRMIIPIIYVDGFIAGTPDIPVGTVGDGAFGLGDINYSAYFSPAEDSKSDWGFGPSITFPSATDDQLGSGKWSAGPTAALLQIRPPWVFTLIARQLWSFAGDSDRPDVNQLLIEPIVSYGLGHGWAFVSDMTITANWDADSSNRWTVPLGGGISKFLMIGQQAVIPRLGAYYNVEKPVGAPNWYINFTLRFLFPK
jgi:hypothetical protein